MKTLSSDCKGWKQEGIKSKETAKRETELRLQLEKKFLDMCTKTGKIKAPNPFIPGDFLDKSRLDLGYF